MNSSSEATIPWPPRYRWLKRGIVIGVIVAIALAVLRWQWGLAADRRIKRFVDEAHARGEPGVLDDLKAPVIPDADNAALSLMKAAKLVEPDSEFLHLRDSYEGGILSESQIIEFQSIRSRHADVLKLCRLARSQPKADWAVNITRPIYATRLTNLQSQRTLAEFLHMTAMLDHQTGNDRECIEECRDLLRQSSAVENMCRRSSPG